MNALKFIHKTNGRQLVINLPGEFVNTDLEIIILSTHDPRQGGDFSLPSTRNEDLAIAQSFFGIAKSDAPFSEEDFYKQ